MKPMVYPYKIRITDPELIQAFKLVSDTGFCHVKPKTARKIGHHIPKIIKKDGLLIHDGSFGIFSNRINLTYKPANGRRKGYDFVFKSLF